MSDPVYDKLDELINQALTIIWNNSETEESFAFGVIAFTSKFTETAFKHRMDKENQT